MIFYKKINDSGNVWAFNMTYFFNVFILGRKRIICIFIQNTTSTNVKYTRVIKYYPNFFSYYAKKAP
ncbi:hypothetical protein COJ48_22005 [Bacillus cereus]|nr:hypothetical protein COJ48_22005 [Bacillus cereus]PGP83002.1 hypothetical protein CN997_12855 [Bacillus cereus]